MDMANGSLNYSEPVRITVFGWLRILLEEPPYAILASLSLIATVANLMTIVTIVMAKSKAPYFRLILNLAISDLTISLSTIAFFIHKILSPVNLDDTYRLCMFLVLKNMNNIGMIISLLTLMGMAIDQYIGILYPFRYQSLMSKKRSYFMIILFWVISILCGFSDLFTGVEKANMMRKAYPNQSLKIYGWNFCYVVLHETPYTEEFIVFAVAFICCTVMMFIYAKIYGEVKKQRRRIPVCQEFARNNKALITTLIILGTFLLCWLPLCIFELSMIAITRIWPEYTASKSNRNYFSKINLCLLDLMLVNTILDPLIYSLRMREVRTSFTKLFCRCLRKLPSPQRGSYYENRSHLSMVTMSTNGSRKPSRVSLGSIHDRRNSIQVEGEPILPEAGSERVNQLDDVPELPSDVQEPHDLV